MSSKILIHEAVAESRGAESRAPVSGSATPASTEDALTVRTRTVWTAGDFHSIAQGYSAGAEEFVTRLAPRRGETVLDVACGTGNLAIPAAQSGANVTGVDIAPNLIERARLEARAAGHDIRFEVGDAESLPYEAGSFDTTMTMFGAMFAARPERAAAELLRVTRPGGRIAMANWTPESFVATMLRAHVAVAPPPAGVPSPLGWGDENTVRSRFGDGAASIVCQKRTLFFRFAMPPARVADLFAECYGPTVTALRVAGEEGGARLRAELARLFTEHNRADGETTVVESEYLEVRVKTA